MSNDVLCARCALLDLDLLFNGPRHGGWADNFDDHKVELQTLDKIIGNNSCPFCRLIHHIVDTARYGRFHQPPENMNATSDTSLVTCYIIPWRADDLDRYMIIPDAQRDLVATALRVYLKPGYARPESNGVCRMLSPVLPSLKQCGPQISRPLLNANPYRNRSLSDIREWLTRCIQDHPDCRTLTNGGHAPDISFHVIDVNTRQLVETSIVGCAYAALSYVWGSKADLWVSKIKRHVLETDPGNIPDTLPNTIEDAFSVCKELQIRFLWVDLLCIDHVSPKKRRKQVLGMDEVYRQAQVVLVSLATRNADEKILKPDSELPQHYSQRTETVSGKLITTCLPSMSQEMALSKWRERGWTLQEGLLARRCILLGAGETAFVCRQCLKRQSDYWGPESPDIQTFATLWSDRLLPTNTKFLEQSTWSFENYHHLMRDYSTRRLSRYTDIIDAVSGCFSLFSKSQNVRFVHGIPLSDLHFGLLWDDKWRDDRQSDFPSWSWAGWRGLQYSYWLYPSARQSTRGLLKGGFLRNHLLTSSEIHVSECQFADVEVSEDERQLRITSSFVHFSVSFVPLDQIKSENVCADISGGRLKHNLPDGLLERGTATDVIKSHEYYRGCNLRLQILDTTGSSHQTLPTRWHLPHDPVKLHLPDPMTGKSVILMLEKGLTFAKLIEFETTDGDQALHLVIFLIVRQLGTAYERFGSGYMSKAVWDNAQPETCSIDIS